MPIEIKEVQALLRSGKSPREAAEALGVTLRTLQRAWAAANGDTTMRAWALDACGSQAEGVSPLVSFRLREYPALVAAAAADGKTPNIYARDILRYHLSKKK